MNASFLSSHIFGKQALLIK